jgi:hypothetical protein
MAKSVLKIRDTEHDLEQVFLRLHFREEEGDDYLDFDLFADSENLKKAGIAINAMTMRGVTNPQEIAGTIFMLEDDTRDELDELRESVICEPDQALELSQLEIRFGNLVEGYISIELRATCFSVNEETLELHEDGIPVTASLLAQTR